MFECNQAPDRVRVGSLQARTWSPAQSPAPVLLLLLIEVSAAGIQLAFIWSTSTFLIRVTDALFSDSLLALTHIMPLRSPPETQAEGHNRPRSSSTHSASTQNGSTNAARKRPLSLVVATGRAPLVERSPNTTPVPTTPTNATINKRVPSLIPSLPAIRRVSAPIMPNVERPPLPPQTRAAAARESFPSRPSAPTPESTATSVVSSIRSMKKRTDQEDDTSLAAPQLQPTEPLTMSTITAFHDPPTLARRGPSGTPRRTISMAVRSPGQSSEHDSSVSGPLRRPGVHTRQTLQRPLSYQVPAKTPPRLTSTTRGALALSPQSHADSSRSDTTDSSMINAMHFMSDPNMPQSNAPSVWEGDGGDASTSFEMETEVAELNDMVDEDVGVMINGPIIVLIAYCHCYFLWTGGHCPARRTSRPYKDHHCIQASPRASPVEFCISASRIASRAQAPQGHVGFGTGTATQERAGEGSRPPSARLSNGVCAAHVYDTPLTALRANSSRSRWTLPALCGAMAEAYSMKPRSDEPFGLSSCRIVCDCEWIILEFCRILTYSDSIGMILDGANNDMPGRPPLLTLL